MRFRPDPGTPAERALNAMTPKQLEAAAARGNRMAAKLLARMARTQAKAERKARRKKEK